MELKYNLASVLIDKSDYNKARRLLKNVIKMHCKQSKPDRNKLSECYYYMAMTLRYIGDYKNARTNILSAMKNIKNSYNCHCEYAKILYKLGAIKEAEENFEKALEITTKKNGKMHPATAVILSHYGLFLLSTGKKDLAIKNLNNAYSILKDTLGEENLYTIRISSHISNFLFMEKKYAESFEKMKAVFLKTGRILGDDNCQTLICKTNCSRSLIKMRKYADALDYLETPFVITDNKERMILLAYNKTIMEAPEVFIIKTGPSVLRIIKIMERKNIPIIKSDIFKKGILDHCNQFEPISQEYYKPVAIILSRILKRWNYVN
jgi:tetratricopeptide (TPR) repeat protein